MSYCTRHTVCFDGHVVTLPTGLFGMFIKLAAAWAVRPTAGWVDALQLDACKNSARYIYRIELAMHKERIQERLGVKRLIVNDRQGAYRLNVPVEGTSIEFDYDTFKIFPDHDIRVTIQWLKSRKGGRPSWFPQEALA